MFAKINYGVHRLRICGEGQPETETSVQVKLVLGFGLPSAAAMSPNSAIREAMSSTVIESTAWTSRVAERLASAASRFYSASAIHDATSLGGVSGRLAQWRIRAALVRPVSVSRSAASAPTMTALSWLTA
jgi:hypothetical protein